MNPTFSIDFSSLSEDELAELIDAAEQEQDRRAYHRFFEAGKDKVLTALENFCNAIDKIPDHDCLNNFDTRNFYGNLGTITNVIAELELSMFED